MDFSGGREIPCLLDSSAKKILRERLASLLIGHFNTKQLMKSLKEFYSNSNRALKVLKDLVKQRDFYCVDGHAIFTEPG